MQGVGRVDDFVLQMPDNKTDAVPCERLPEKNLKGGRVWLS